MKLKLYHKTFIITFITTLLTIGIFAFLFQNLTSSLVGKIAKDQFNVAVAAVKSINKAEQFTAQNFSAIEKQTKASIQVVNQQRLLVYPQLGLVSYSTTAPTIQSAGSVVDVTINETTSYYETVTINVDNEPYIVHVMYFKTIDTSEMQQVFRELTPYIIGVAFLISLLVSYVYSKKVTEKIESINNTMISMASLTHEPDTAIKHGDEIDELEMHVNELYTKLREEMDKIKRFEKDREVFMRGTIHELKTPIMLMNLQLREMLSEQDNAELEDKILRLQHRLDAMQELVNGGLDLSKIDAIKDAGVTKFDVVLDEVMDYYAYMIADKNLDVVVDHEFSTILMHGKHLSNILSNLVTNAIRYTDEYGTIKIVQTDGQFTIMNAYSHDIANFDDLAKAFVRGQADEDGHGLGLYLVTTTLQKYGLTYDYKLENGYFTFTFKY